MEKQIRKSVILDKFSSRSRSDPLEHIFEIMDQALYFVNHVIDVNIQMQQIIIQIRKKLVKNELATLRQLYKVYLNCNKLQKYFNDKIYIFDIHNFDSISPELFIRFYGRLSQKTFCKFLYYSLNYKSLQFLTSNLLELLDINDQLNNYKNIQNFNIFINIISFILEQNKILLQILLELIVSENYVSSLDQFFMSVPEKQIAISLFSTKNQEGGQSRKRKNDIGQELAIKPTHYSNYKQKLDSMIKNYQAKEERDSFLNGFTLTLKKQFGILIQNETKDNLFHIFEKQKMQKRSKKVSIKLQNDSYKKSKLNINKFEISNQQRQKLKLHEKSILDDSDISASQKTRKFSKGESSDFFVPTHSSNSMSRKSKIVEVDSNFLIMQNRNDEKNKNYLDKKKFLNKKNMWKNLKEHTNSNVQEKPKSAIESNSYSKRIKINKDLTQKYKHELKDIFEEIQRLKKMKATKKLKVNKQNIQNPQESNFKNKSAFIYIPKSISNFVLKYQINIGKHKSHLQLPLKHKSIHTNSNDQLINLCAQNTLKLNEQFSQFCNHNSKKFENDELDSRYWYETHFKHKNNFTITDNYLKAQDKNIQKNKLICKLKNPRHEIFSTHLHKRIYPT